MAQLRIVTCNSSFAGPALHSSVIAPSLASTSFNIEASPSMVPAETTSQFDVELSASAYSSTAGKPCASDPGLSDMSRAIEVFIAQEVGLFDVMLWWGKEAPLYLFARFVQN